MKLIIDIPDNIYYAIKKAQTIISGQRSGKTLLQILVNSVENGTPLDDVRAEIKSWYWQVEKQALAKDTCVVDAMVDFFIRTIDNIGKADMRGDT